MGWLGMIVGAIIGNASRIPLGGLLGGIIGAVVEEKIRNGVSGAETVRPRRTRMSQTGEDRERREIVFLTAAAAMFAKMAKADGRITSDEIAYVEQAFMRLGFTGERRDFCISVFRRAKDDGITIYAYAAEFAACEPHAAVREMMYSMLWDLACADGQVSSAELAVLRHITMHLGVRSALFEFEAERRIGGRRSREGSRRSYGGGQSGDGMSERDAYAILGCSASATNAELKRAYRELAKQNHPDALRARGVPEELVKKANEKMARVNAAWSEIRRIRSI